MSLPALDPQDFSAEVLTHSMADGRHTSFLLQPSPSHRGRCRVVVHFHSILNKTIDVGTAYAKMSAFPISKRKRKPNWIIDGDAHFNNVHLKIRNVCWCITYEFHVPVKTTLTGWCLLVVCNLFYIRRCCSNIEGDWYRLQADSFKQWPLPWCTLKNNIWLPGLKALIVILR